MSIQQISLGQVISNEPIPKFHAKEGLTSVISIPDPNYTFAVKTFYIDQRKTADKKNILGYVHATDEIISLLGSPNLHYFILCLKYGLNGMYVKDGYGTDVDRIEFNHLKFGNASYEKLRSISNSVRDISKLDLQITVNPGKESYQDINIIPVTEYPTKDNVAMWRLHPEVVQKVDTYKTLFRNTLESIAAKNIPAELVKKYISGEMQAKDILDIVNKDVSFDYVAGENNNPALSSGNYGIRSLPPAPTVTVTTEPSAPMISSESSIDISNLMKNDL